MKIEFKEEQQFRQWWLWLVLIGIGVMPVFGMYKQLIIGGEFGAKPMSDLAFILFCLVIFCVIGLFWFMRLKTEIDQNEIRMSFFPFVKKRVSWSEVESAEIVNYGFVGGWGIRLWTEFGTVYNTKGSKGLAIELFNGEKFLIGTQKENELDKIGKEARLQKLI